MEFTPYANVVTGQGETLVLVPVADLRRLEEFEKQARAEPCTHPEDALTYTELLPDVAVCSACGALLGIGDTIGTWTRLTAVELEAEILERVREAVDEIDNAYTSLRQASVETLINLTASLQKQNPVLQERRRRERERARALYHANAAAK